MYNKLHKQYTLQFDILQYKNTFQYRGSQKQKWWQDFESDGWIESDKLGLKHHVWGNFKG